MRRQYGLPRFGGGRPEEVGQNRQPEDRIMVDDIHFPKGLPPVSASGRVQRVNRKKRESENPPFEKFINKEDPEDKKKKKRKKDSDKVAIGSHTKEPFTRNFIESSNETDATETEDDSDKKIIDVRV
jgi:hypothetical protein